MPPGLRAGHTAGTLTSAVRQRTAPGPRQAATTPRGAPGRPSRRLLLFLHLFGCPSPPRPHVFNSYQRQEFGTRRPQQTPFPRAGPGAGKEEGKREPSVGQARGRRARLPASKCPGPECPRKGAGVPLPCAEGLGEKRRGCARQDGRSRRTASIKGRRQTARHGARDPLKTQSRKQVLRNPPAAAGAPPGQRSGAPSHRRPNPPAAREGSSPSASSDPGSPRRSAPRVCRAVPPSGGSAAARPVRSLAHSPRPSSSSRGSRTAPAGAVGTPCSIIYPARVVSVSPGRAHLCR